MMREWRQKVDLYLQTALSGRQGIPSGLKGAIEYALFPGGKRLRALLVMTCCAATGGAVESSLPAAAAVEMVHSYSLVHDDMPEMDNAPSRRGKPSVHKAFGTGTALLVGDALLTLAFEVLSELPANEARRCMALLSRCAGPEGMVGGQFIDTMEDASGPLERAIEVARLKTGRLFAASSGMGYIAGGSHSGGDDAMLDAALRFGESLGIAYQIIDDVRDWASGEDQGKLELPALICERDCEKMASGYIVNCLSLAREFANPGLLMEFLKTALPNEILACML